MTIPFAILSISLMILLPVVLAILLRRRFSVPWWLFCVGILTFAVSQLYHIPLNNWLVDLGIVDQVPEEGPSLLMTSIILGLSAGISETIARGVGIGILFWRNGKTSDSRQPGSLWEDGVMIGLGHGGFEAMGFVAVLTAASFTTLWALQGVDLATMNIPVEQMAGIRFQIEQLSSSPWVLFIPLLERGLAIILHVILSLLVWSAFKKRNWLYLLVAILYHGLVDGSLVYLGVNIQNPWVLEALLVVFLLPGVLWAWRSMPVEKDTRPHIARPLSNQFNLFYVALIKELNQQWRTKRVLIVAAVFVLFGLGSPLIANFIPQMFSSIPEVEQFAELIPTPSNKDAMDQYISNLTQFGFIIAVLMGMGAVASEKEKGTTAMILSKPMPRWAFILSKFVAQTLIFGVGFLVSALGAFYYTMILFEPFTFWPFMLGNVLLLLWLSVFTAVTLLGSTIGRSTGAAAGIALVGAIILLLAGSLPKIGVFFPSALVAWAGQLGLVASPVANGGALVANVVIIVVCLITAVSIFEVQEL